MPIETVARVTSLIATALGLPPGRVSEEDSIDTIGQWDSLGHLNILTSLEKTFGSQVARIPTLAKATSVKQIVALLQAYQIL